MNCENEIIANAEKDAVTNPPNYFELSGRSPDFPQSWEATGFSHDTTLSDHFDRHGAALGAATELGYATGAKEFLHSPLGKSGEVFVGGNNWIYRFDHDTGVLAIAEPSGQINTYWGIGTEKGMRYAAKRWAGYKNSYKR